MNGRLHGKKILVTAAGQGIGRAIAERFAAEGATLIATSLQIGDLAAMKSANVTVHALDVTDAAAIVRMRDAVGAIDVLVNCAGFVHHGTILDCTDQDFEFSTHLNVRSAYRMIQAFLPAMLARGSGTIVTIGSAVSSIIGAPNRFVYGVTKAALIGLTKSVAVDFVAKGIRANIICPGTVDTPSLRGRMAARGDVDEARKAFIARQPMGRLGKAEEIASLAVYLASDESSFVTGQEFIIDGGWSAG